MNIFDTLSLNDQKKCQIVKLEKGQILFRENDKCNKVGIVLKGEISIVSYSYKGNEILYNSVFSGEMFGNNLIFSSINLFRGNVIADTESEVALINKETLISFLQNNKDFLTSFLAYEAELTKALNYKIKLLSIDNAEERFMFFLQTHGEKITISSVTNLAKTLSLQRETLSRLISKLEKNKIIIRNRKSIKKVA